MGKPAYRLAILILALALQSCGFALRGSDAITANFSSLALNLQQPQSEFSRLLERSLEMANVGTNSSLDASSETIPTLAVANERVSNRPVTINPRARASQVEIRLSVDISLIRGELELIPTETLMVDRVYFQDIENIAGNQEEVQIITAELRRELVNQLMRRLESAPQ
jgi:LPS-assembly lipoprotein